eukprot:2601325-Rhodomonas_salina.2
MRVWSNEANGVLRYKHTGYCATNTGGITLGPREGATNTVGNVLKARGKGATDLIDLLIVAGHDA